MIAFATDWILYHVMKLWRHFDENFTFSLTTIYLEIAGQLLAYSNACCNPVVYAFVSKGFRNDFKKVIDLSGVSGRMTPKFRLNKRGGAAKPEVVTSRNVTQFTCADAVSSPACQQKQKLLDVSGADCCGNSLDVKI